MTGYRARSCDRVSSEDWAWRRWMWFAWHPFSTFRSRVPQVDGCA
jgi:hypothetical protein